ncbi:MAG: hypothetical protein J1E83_00360 [Lachnospiraceae bacterium]|nr:hypothetical protein [Lachnospiraceae bacterium]
MGRPSNELKKISKSVLAGLLCCVFLGGCTSAVPIAQYEDPTGTDTVESVQDKDSEPEENNIQETVSFEVPTEPTFQVFCEDGSELPVAFTELFLTGDGAYNQFDVSIITGEDSELTEEAYGQVFYIQIYIPVSECADGTIYDIDYLSSSGGIAFISYNVADYHASVLEGDPSTGMPDFLSIDDATFVLHEYVPESYAVFSLTADVTVEDTAYTLEAAGTVVSTVDSVQENNVTPQIPTEEIYKVSYKNGSELPVSWGTLYLTGDDSDSYNLFHAEILTGGDLSDPLAAMADTQYFGITAYIPVSDCADGLIYDDDYFASNGAVYFNYNNPDIDFIPELLTIDNVTLVLYEYSPESHATFSLTADITVEDISYTFEAAGSAAYLENSL